MPWLLDLAGDGWCTVPVFDDDPDVVMAACRSHQLEGIVAKRTDARYQPGKRSRSWVKAKTDESARHRRSGLTIPPRRTWPPQGQAAAVRRLLSAGVTRSTREETGMRGFGRVAVVAVLVAMLAACGSGGGEDSAEADAPASEFSSSSTAPTETTEPETTPSTEPAPTSIPPEAFPFVTCSDGTASVSFLDADSQEVTPVISGLDNVCNLSGTLHKTTLSASGRYLVSVWDDSFGQDASFTATDLSTGAQVTITQEDLDAWATAQTGGGLDASERTLEIGGVDRNGDGTIYVSELAEDSAIRASQHYALDLADLTATGELTPVEQPSDLLCYWWSGWSPDGASCLVDVDVVDAAQVTPTDMPSVLDEMPLDQVPFNSWWVDNSSVVSADVYGKKLLYTIVGEDPLTIYEISGDRRLTPWVNSTTGRVLLVSPVLDGTTREVFVVELDPGSEPQLLTTLPDADDVLSF